MRTLALMLAALLVFAVPAIAAPANPGGNCDTPYLEKFDNEPRGEFTLGDVTFIITAYTVAVTGGDADICVKAADTNSGLVSMTDGQVYEVDFLNPGGQTPAISNVVAYRAAGPSIGPPDEPVEPDPDYPPAPTVTTPALPGPVAAAPPERIEPAAPVTTATAAVPVQAQPTYTG